MHTWMHAGFVEKLMHSKVILQFNIQQHVLLPANIPLQNINPKSSSPSRLKRIEHRIDINCFLLYVYPSQVAIVFSVNTLMCMHESVCMSVYWRTLQVSLSKDVLSYKQIYNAVTGLYYLLSLSMV